MNGYVCFHAFLVLAQELSDSFDFRFRFGEGTAIRVIARMRRGTFIWGSKGRKDETTSSYLLSGILNPETVTKQ